MDSFIIDFFTQLGGWNWLIIAGILLMLELVIPGFHLLFFGLAALIVGLLGATFAIPWQAELVIFAILSIVSVYFARKFWNPHVASDEPLLNKRGQKFIGKSYTLITPLENGRGKVKVGDSPWVVTGPDLPAGSKVKVIDVDDSVLIVEADN